MIITVIPLNCGHFGPEKRKMNINKRIKVAIADDHALFRMGLANFLMEVPDLEIAVEAANGALLLKALESQTVDVVLMDVEMPSMDGLVATSRLRELHPDTLVVILSSHNDPSMILKAIESGARGYLLKESKPSELIEAIHSVVQNGFCFNENVSQILLKAVLTKETFNPKFNPLPELTEREMEVLTLICKELTSAEIGDKLFLSVRTVETHRKNLMEKVGARNTVGLVLFALKHQLVDI